MDEMKTKDELEAMTKDELVDYADDHDIDVQRHWVKDEIVKEIIKGQKAIAKEEAKHAETKPAAAAAPAAAAHTQTAEVQDATVKINPELAKIQELANQPPDDSTRFASEKPKDE